MKIQELDVSTLQELLIIETRKYTAVLRGTENGEPLESIRQRIEDILRLIAYKKTQAAASNGQ